MYDLITLNGPVFIDAEAGIVKTTGGTSVLKVDASMVRGGDIPFHQELQYLGALQELLDKADSEETVRDDRTGTGTHSVFGRQMRFNLTEEFPLLTTKKVFSKGVFGELCWFLKGDTNTEYLHENGVSIWDEWADEDGNLGPVYGKQWRAWQGEHGFIDQLKNVIDEIKANPRSRRLVVSAWNADQLDRMALQPCHVLFQFYVTDEGELCCHMYQRSADIFLGVPFNIASYAALTHVVAQECGLKPAELVVTFGDLHLYSNHVEQARTQLNRTPKPLPKLVLNHKGTGISAGASDYEPDDFQLEGYEPHPSILAEVAV